MKRMLYIIALTAVGCIAAYAQPTSRPVDHGIARSIEHRQADPTDPAATDLIVVDYADGTHTETPVAVEPGERQRRLRAKRIQTFREKPTVTLPEMKAAMNDLIDAMNQQ